MLCSVGSYCSKVGERGGLRQGKAEKKTCLLGKRIGGGGKGMEGLYEGRGRNSGRGGEDGQLLPLHSSKNPGQRRRGSREFLGGSWHRRQGSADAEYLSARRA